MYLISAYFDDKTNHILNRYMKQIAAKTGNTFMSGHQVPPHLTLSSVEARQGEQLFPCLEQLQKPIAAGTVPIVSVGMFFPYVMYLTPVLNEYLMNLSRQIYDAVNAVPEVNINRFYQPMNWLPHITIGKTLTKEQMRIAFAVMQESFAPLTGRITRIGLASTNPHQDLLCLELDEY